MKIWRIKAHIISREIFLYSLITYLILKIAESMKPGLVSYFFNLNILLWIVLIIGVAMVITFNEKLDKTLKSEETNKIRVLTLAKIILLSIGTFLLIWYKTQDLGAISIVISFLTLILVVIISLLAMTEAH